MGRLVMGLAVEQSDRFEQVERGPLRWVEVVQIRVELRLLQLFDLRLARRLQFSSLAGFAEYPDLLIRFLSRLV